MVRPLILKVSTVKEEDYMKTLETIFSADSNENGGENETIEAAVGLQQQRQNEQSRLKKVNRKIHKLQERMDDICCWDKAERKRIKQKITKYKAERKDIKSSIRNIEQRLARVEESISLIIPEVLKFRTYCRQQLIQKMCESDNPREIEAYVKMLEGGAHSGK